MITENIINDPLTPCEESATCEECTDHDICYGCNLETGDVVQSAFDRVSKGMRMTVQIEIYKGTFDTYYKVKWYDANVYRNMVCICDDLYTYISDGGQLLEASLRDLDRLCYDVLSDMKKEINFKILNAFKAFRYKLDVCSYDEAFDLLDSYYAALTDIKHESWGNYYIYRKLFAIMVESGYASADKSKAFGYHSTRAYKRIYEP